jgi:hypothetical protein
MKRRGAKHAEKRGEPNLCKAQVAIARKLRGFRVQTQETDRIMAGQNHAEQ